MSGQRILRAMVFVCALFGAFSTSACLVDDESIPDTSTIESEIALPPPMNVMAVAVSPTRIDVTWTPVVDPTLKRYVIYRGTMPGNETTLTSLPPGRTSYTSNNLTPGQQYCFYLRTINTSNERSVNSDTACVTTPASSTTPPPGGVVATALSSTRIRLDWNAVAGATSYKVFMAEGAGPFAYAITVASPTTTYTTPPLQPSTSYSFYVTATSTAGESAPSATASTTTLARTAAPANVVATAISESRITVTWNAVPAATAYRIFMAEEAGPFAFEGSVAPPTTTFTAVNLAAATTYSFYVIADSVDGGDSLPSATAVATTFSAGAEGHWRFDERSGGTAADSSGFGRNATLVSAGWSTDRPPVYLTRNRSVLSISAATASVANVAAAPAFRFAGGDFSLSLWVKLPAAVDTDIVGMRAAGCGTLGWKLGQDAVNGLNVSGGGGTFAFGTSLTAGTWYQVGFTFESATNTLTTYVNGAQTAQGPYSPFNALSGLPLNIGHVGGCAGGAVLIDELRIFSRTLSAGEAGELGTQPPAPTLTVMNTDATHQVLSWDAVPGAVQYIIYKGTASGNQVYWTSFPGTTYTAQHLTANTQYSWYVRAEVGEVASTPSNEVVLTTVDFLPAPTVTAMPISRSRIGVSWTAVPGATGYRIYQSTDDVTYTQRGTVLAPTVTFQAANLSAGTLYYYKVAAIDVGANPGYLSAAASATTLP